MNRPWEIFYSPHTDDETIGMAGAILRAHYAKHRVLVVLVTDNLPSVRGLRLFPGCDVALERRKEWMRAMDELHVTDVTCWELPEADMLVNQRGMAAVIQEKMQELDDQYPVAQHHTVWGVDDVHVEASLPTMSHVLCAEAAKELYRTRISTRIRVTLHGVYVYSNRERERRASIVQCLTHEQMETKSRALSCFKPSSQSIGYGFASVPELINAASTDPREFIQEVPHDTSCAD